MPAVVAGAFRAPRHDVGRGGTDVLAAAGAAVRLRCGGAADAPHHPVTVAAALPLLVPDDAGKGGTFLVLAVPAAAGCVTARAHPSRLEHAVSLRMLAVGRVPVFAREDRPDGAPAQVERTVSAPSCSSFPSRGAGWYGAR